MSSIDSYNRPDLNFKYDIQRVEVGLYDSDLDMLHFWILFNQPLTSNMFNDNQGSWAGILIDTNNDEKDEIIINTLSKSYTSNYGETASASYRNGTKSCSATSWMDLDNKTGWLGFKVSQKCLGLGNKFRVLAYADYISTDNASFDYAPDSYELIDLGDFYNPKPKITTAVPQATSLIGKKLSNYSSAPENLVNLSASLRDSVATIECIVGNSGGTGTAWSAKVDIPIATYKSYLITNYHVISDCVTRGTVDVILNDNTRLVGNLAVWDPDNDVAGIYVSKLVPALVWQGEKPVQGSWVGVIGSPKGLPGILTTGIVSSVSSVENYVTFTAPINPGNSGGPVFDSIGRVIAIATAKIQDSEGFGIGNGTPLICKVVVKCSANLNGWDSKLSDAELAAAAVAAAESALAEAKAKAAADALAAAIAEAKAKAAADAADAANAAIEAANIAANSENTDSLTIELRIAKEKENKQAVQIKLDESKNRLENAQAKLNVATSESAKTIYASAISSWNSAIRAYESKVRAIELEISKLEAAKVIIENANRAAAELKAKEDAEAKAVAEIRAKLEAEAQAKAFAERLLADAKAEAARILAAAKASATKKATIICVKGKLTKKVTAVKPICPSGYKVKK